LAEKDGASGAPVECHRFPDAPRVPTVDLTMRHISSSAEYDGYAWDSWGGRRPM